MEVVSTIHQVQRALSLENFDSLEAQLKMAPRPRPIVRMPESPGQPRQGGVLIILYEAMGYPHLVLTKRRDDLQSHAGQISFPGGRREVGETLQSTAFREANEEIGVRPGELAFLGHLSSLYIPPSDYEVYPFVAWFKNGRPAFTPQETEVAEILEVPLPLLLDPTTRLEEPWEIRGFQLQVPFYSVFGHKVWGATAMMLSEFLERLRVAGI